jgi:hypothetical protein
VLDFSASFVGYEVFRFRRRSNRLQTIVVSRAAEQEVLTIQGDFPNVVLACHLPKLDEDVLGFWVCRSLVPRQMRQEYSLGHFICLTCRGRIWLSGYAFFRRFGHTTLLAMSTFFQISSGKICKEPKRTTRSLTCRIFVMRARLANVLRSEKHAKTTVPLKVSPRNKFYIFSF